MTANIIAAILAALLASAVAHLISKRFDFGYGIWASLFVGAIGLVPTVFILNATAHLQVFSAASLVIIVVVAVLVHPLCILGGGLSGAA